MGNFVFGEHSLSCEKKKYIMGILNVTPDSFSDGGKYNEVSKAILYAEKMLLEGADIIDIGAVSTRPFAKAVDEKTEWDRLKDVIKEIRKNSSAVLSVDTFSPGVAERCLDAGVDIINDVSGIFSSEMAGIIKKYSCGWIIMHSGVKVRETHSVTEFPDGIINDINGFFADMLNMAEEYGISGKQLCFDAGFGFSKDVKQNAELLHNFHLLDSKGSFLLCGLSRKRFINALAGLSENDFSEGGTLMGNIIALNKGADIIRVHDVSLHRQAMELAYKMESM